MHAMSCGAEHGPEKAAKAVVERKELATIALIAAVTGCMVRWWVRAGVTARWWRDSAEYLTVSRASLFSTRRWAGSRPVLLPSLISVVSQRLGALVAAQVLIGALCWAVLTVAVAWSLPPGWRRRVGAGAMVALSVTGPVVMWDAQVLTESLAWSTLALVTAALIWAARSFDRRSAAALVGATALLLAARDSNVIPVLLGAAAWAGWAVLRRPPVRRLVLVSAGVLAVLSIGVVATANHGDRQRQPTEHLYAARVIPYPDRLAWFEAHGMPEGDLLRRLPSSGKPGQARWTPIPHGIQFSPWRRWVNIHGRTAFARYVITHPAYLVSEPLQRPEHTFDSGRGIDSYRPHGLRSVPFVTGLLWPSVAVTVVLATGAVAAVRWRKVGRSPLVMAGLVLVVTAGPHALVVWHSDGMESARHLLIPSAQLRIGALLLLLAAGLARSPAAAADPPQD